MRLEEANGDYFVMDSGRRFYANNGILGIGVYLDECDDYRSIITVSGGYDGGVNTRDFTPAERQELAEYVTDLWRKFAEAK